MPVTPLVLCYAFRFGACGQRQVLLGHKKQDFCTGKIMGLGGHVEPGESDSAAALREAQEEAGITPEWFDVDRLPLDQMLDDEAYWLPRVLAGEILAGTITYDGSGTLVAQAELHPAAGLGGAPGAGTG